MAIELRVCRIDRRFRRHLADMCSNGFPGLVADVGYVPVTAFGSPRVKVPAQADARPGATLRR